MAKFAAGDVATGSKFATGVVDIGGAPSHANISPRIFKKVRNDSTYCYFRGLGGRCFLEKTGRKKSRALSL